MQPYGDNFIPVIPVDYTEHTSDHPFCGDPSCFCHEDADAIAKVNEAVQAGLATPDDATRIVRGETF